MGKKITVEFRDADLYKDLQEIARLVKERPEELLQRAFKEWIELREDLEDAASAKEAIAEYERDGGIPLEEVMEGLGLNPERTR
jgi:predicted transcriptional regulator